jgi:hypothetical protein
MTNTMNRHWDLAFGTGGFIGTITLAQINTAIACAVGLTTLAVMGLRLRREWRHRNKRPDDGV